MTRKTKYTPELVKQLIGLLRKGNTDVDACSRVGISKDTFYDWIKKYPDFSDSISHARAATRELAVKAWRSWLTPFEVIEKSTDTFSETRLDKNGQPYEYVKKTVTETVKTMAPDWRAAESYLKRRDPENWADRQNIDLKSNGKELQSLTAERLNALDKLAESQLGEWKEVRSGSTSTADSAK